MTNNLKAKLTSLNGMPRNEIDSFHGVKNRIEHVALTTI